MKKLLSILFVVALAIAAKAQNHDGVYTVVIARNANGNILANTAINLRYSIHDSAANGAVVYQETFSTTTSAQGMFNVTIGKGTPVIGSFNNINWGTNEKFVQTEMATNGNNFIDMGTQQMMSVPYAIHAKTAEIAESVTNAGVGFNGYAVFDSVGSFTWTVPSGVHKIIVECWGGGGNGLAGIGYGGSGGGGGYAKSILNVSPGENYNLIVGSGGGNIPNGENSVFGNNIVIGNGGQGFGFYNGYLNNGFMLGGNGIGQIVLTGQSGGFWKITSVSNNGASYVSGGASPNGGFSGSYPQPPGIPGGGGDGSNPGAHGRVIITY